MSPPENGIPGAQGLEEGGEGVELPPSDVRTLSGLVALTVSCLEDGLTDEATILQRHLRSPDFGHPLLRLASPSSTDVDFPHMPDEDEVRLFWGQWVGGGGGVRPGGWGGGVDLTPRPPGFAYNWHVFSMKTKFVCLLFWREGCVCAQFMHGRSRMTVDARVPPMPGRGTTGCHRSGGYCLHPARSAVRGSASVNCI